MPTRSTLARLAATLAIAALAIAALASTALATRHIRIASEVTLAVGNPFHGKVNSKPYSHACRPQRTVKVFRVDPGPDGLFGKTTTDQKGRWSMSGGMPHGKFYAVVKKLSQGTAGTIYVCKSDTSPTVQF